MPSIHNPITGPYRSPAQPRDAHISATPEIKQYRQEAIRGMKEAQEQRIREAHAQWKKERGIT